MKIVRHKSGRLRRRGLLMTFLSCLIIAGVAWGIPDQVTRTLGQQERDSGQPEENRGLDAAGRCLSRRAPEFPPGLVPKGQPILAGPIVVGCARRLGEPIRFIAYTQATSDGGEQLCYVLEQLREKVATGGSCIEISPSLAWCTESCPLRVVGVTVAEHGGRQSSKATLVTGAASGVIKKVALSTEPLGNHRVTPSFIATLNGSAQRTLHLSTVVSLFASEIVPCIPARQGVYARVRLADGQDVSMQGLDPFGCQT